MRRELIRLVLVISVLAVAVLTAACGQATKQDPPRQLQGSDRPGVAVPPMADRSHIATGAPHEPYSTDPPTSGPHYNYPAAAGFYTKAPVDEQLVHSMEHGYVIIWYRANDLDPAKRQQLIDGIKGSMSAAGNSKYTNTPKIIAVPRPSLKSRVVLTSWGHMEKLDQFDEQRILDYIKYFRDEAPEFTTP